MLVLVWMTGGCEFSGDSVSDLHSIILRACSCTRARRGLGWLMAGSGLGAVLGAVTVACARADSASRQGRVIAGQCVFFAAIIGFCYSRIFVLSQCLLLVEGYSAILMISSLNVAIQHLSSDEMRGRVMSIYATCFLGSAADGGAAGWASCRGICPRAMCWRRWPRWLAAIFMGFYAFSRPLRELD